MTVSRASEKLALVRKRSILLPLLLFVPHVGLLYFFLAVYVPHAREEAIGAWDGRLSAMADDRRASIDQWLHERLGDAENVASYPTAVRLVGLPESDPSLAGEGTHAHLRERLDQIAHAHGYRGIYILRADHSVVAMTTGSAMLQAPCLEAVRRAIEHGTREVDVFAHTGSVDISTFFPIRAPSASSGGAGAVTGVVVLSANPEDWLYPTIRAEPFPTLTGETQLLRREGDSVVYIAPLRHDASAPLFLRRPMDTPGLAARQAIEGRELFGAFVDYRGEPVFAAARRLRNAPWGLVVKVDQSEVLAPYRANVRTMGALLASLLLAAWGVSIGLLRERRAKFERELARGEARYALLLDHANDAIVFIDADGRIRDFNRRAPALFGFGRDELIGMHVRELRAPEERETVARQYQAADDSDGLVFETIHQRPDGTTFPAEVSTRRVPGVDSILFLSIVRDITERKQEEQRRRALEQQLLHAQKMELVGRLASGVAHDFNNVLSVIVNCAEFAKTGLSPTEERYADIEQIEEAAQRAAALTRQLLAFSRQQVGNPTILNVGTAVGGLEKMLRRLIGEHIELVIDVQAHGSIRMDPSHFDQVLVNLAVNARDAMPEGGCLTIRASEISVDALPKGAPSGTAAGTFVRLDVSDNGTGMSDDVLGHVFEPFFTTKASGRGTGLGLATVSSVVQQAKGFVLAHSELGKGTTIHVYWPTTESQPAGVAKSRSVTPAARGSATVLIVEDDERVRSVARRILERSGYRVLLAASGAEAMDVLAGQGGRVGLLLTDAVMPGISGYELIARVRETYPAIRAILMSAHAGDMEVCRRYQERGGVFLPKPFDPKTLVRTVQDLLDAPPDAAKPPG
jgi:PAS domain S-box-containing protein